MMKMMFVTVFVIGFFCGAQFIVNWVRNKQQESDLRKGAWEAYEDLSQLPRTNTPTRQGKR